MRSARATSNAVALAAAAALTAACAARAGPPLVVLDPGHSTAQPGAIGATGRAEVSYNDAFAALLAERLAAAGFRVALTRGPGEALALDARAAKGDGAWLLLALHHDSAQPRYLEQRDRDGHPAWHATRPLRGYSLFVSGENRDAPGSRRAAEAIARRFRALGRPPSLHHAEAIPGEGRPLLDPALGLYRFDELRVLRLAPCPAVLVELGVLVDDEDEAWVADRANQEALADAIVAALRDLRGR